MTPAELHAAIMDLPCIKCGGTLYETGHRDALRSAAELVLAALPAAPDDAEPITEDWLRSVGFTSNHGVEWLYDLCIEQRDGWEIFLRFDESDEWEVQFMQSPIGHYESRGLHIPTAHPKTRGDVLKLCAALGIALPAPPAAAPVEQESGGRPRIVCLCGSGRFREAFEQAEYDETLAGKIVLTIGCNTKDIARTPDLEHHKPMLDELHLRKIDLADEVLLLNVGGYIGQSTRRELEYARGIGKPVRFLEPEATEQSARDFARQQSK